MSKNFKVGIDYGGTKIEGILMDNEGNEILRKRSTYEKNYENGIDTVKSLIEEFDRHTNSTNTVGVCIPCLLYTSPSPRDSSPSRMPSSA